ncbi:unnamed protein product [Timema podura]|uniref:Uncharacterized protein n=1 Tax=Timema podura TaxID=61482 RepID=A0ABN7NUI9_TIMPD|nr:unnamed protein product [Timema podura]
MCLAAVTFDSQNLAVSCRSAPKKSWGYFSLSVTWISELKSQPGELRVILCQLGDEPIKPSMKLLAGYGLDKRWSLLSQT